MIQQDSTSSQRYSIKHLLADWAVLLARDDGKVTSDSSQAGEDLKQEQETTTLSWAQTHVELNELRRRHVDACCLIQCVGNTRRCFTIVNSN